MASGDQEAAALPAQGLGPGVDVLSWVVLAILVAVWGSAFAAISVSVETIAPIWVVGGRMVIAALFLGAWLGIERMFAPAPAGTHITVRAVLWFSFVGVVFTALPFLLYSMAAPDVPSAVLAICNGGTPFFTAVAAHVFIAGEKMTARRALGVALGFLGLLVLVWPDLMMGASARLTGLILAIVGAALYAGSNVMTRLGPPVSPVTASLIMVVAGGIATLIAAPFMAPFPDAPSVPSMLGVAFLGLLPTGWAFILYVWLVRRAGSVFTSFTTYLAPLWATGVGMLFLGEELRWTSLAALAVILLGVAVANLRFKRR